MVVEREEEDGYPRGKLYLVYASSITHPRSKNDHDKHRSPYHLGCSRPKCPVNKDALDIKRGYTSKVGGKQGLMREYEGIPETWMLSPVRSVKVRACVICNVFRMPSDTNEFPSDPEICSCKPRNKYHVTRVGIRL